MKVWQVRRGDLVLCDVKPAGPIEGGTVVTVSHTGICGSDVPKLLRPSSYDLPEPWQPGHEIVGTDRTGQVVAIDPLVPCGTCLRCATGETNLCPALRRLGWDLPGGLAERLVAPAANTHPLPNGLEPMTAVLADPAAVAIHGLRCSPVGPPGQLVVIGAGTVGLLTALYAHDHGWAVTVIHRDGSAPPETVIETIPAKFASREALRVDSIFDVAVDAATGANPTPLQLALQLVRDGGTIVVQNAYHPEVAMPTPLRDLFRRSVRLIGSFSHCRRSPGDFIQALNLLRSNTAQAAKLVTHGGQLADLAAVIGSQSTPGARSVLAVSAS